MEIYENTCSICETLKILKIVYKQIKINNCLKFVYIQI